MREFIRIYNRQTGALVFEDVYDASTWCSNLCGGCVGCIQSQAEYAEAYDIEIGPEFETAELVSYDEVAELASYGGFPVRYPHWYGDVAEEMSTCSESNKKVNWSKEGF